MLQPRVLLCGCTYCAYLQTLLHHKAEISLLFLHFLHLHTIQDSAVPVTLLFRLLASGAIFLKKLRSVMEGAIRPQSGKQSRAFSSIKSSSSSVLKVPIFFCVDSKLLVNADRLRRHSSLRNLMFHTEMCFHFVVIPAFEITQMTLVPKVVVRYWRTSELTDQQRCVKENVESKLCFGRYWKSCRLSHIPIIDTCPCNSIYLQCIHFQPLFSFSHFCDPGIRF